MQPGNSSTSPLLAAANKGVCANMSLPAASRPCFSTSTLQILVVQGPTPAQAPDLKGLPGAGMVDCFMKKGTRGGCGLPIHMSEDQSPGLLRIRGMV